jgi:galactokinase
MSERRETLRVSSPGRVCLFGEHQDYLDLPVISMAISLRIAVEGKRRGDSLVHLDLPDVESDESFSLDGPLAYGRERDYFRSAVNVLRREGLTFASGFDCVVRGNIPIKSGTSSSSALVVAWVDFLARMSEQARELPPEELGRLAHAAEVIEFNEPGGMMDQYTAAFGGLLSIAFHPAARVGRLPARLGAFVLGDSGEPKDTMAILARVKNRVLALIDRLAASHAGFSLQTASRDDVVHLAGDLDRGERDLLLGTIRNRDITREANALLAESAVDDRRIGTLLNEHQAVLRDVLEVSTPKMDRMIDAALRAGARGGKINGSGGGGCVFAYAPEKTEAVARALMRAGGTAYVVRSDAGARVEPPTLHLESSAP